MRRRYKDVVALRLAVRREALARWNDPKGKRPTWDATLTPVEFDGRAKLPQGVAERLAKLPLLARRLHEKDAIEQDVCDRALSQVPDLLRTWLPVAKDTLDIVEGPAAAGLRDLVDLVEAIPAHQERKLRREVFEYVCGLLAPRDPTAQELAWASLLCGAEVKVDPKKGSLVSDVIISETKAMRHFVK